MMMDCSRRSIQEKEDTSLNFSDKVEVVENLKVDAQDNGVIKTLFEGSLAENSEAILNSLSKLTKAETKCKEVKSLFEGAFVENYKGIRENLEKLVDEIEGDVKKRR